MLDLTLHTPETAPEGSADAMAQAEAAYGFIPNLIAYLANAPAAVDAYMGVAKAFDGSTLSPTEQQTVLLSTSFENRCHYCMPAHTTVGRMVGMADEVLDGLRDGRPVADPRLESLRRFTVSVVRNRGWVPEKELQAFLDAGFTREQVLEVLTGVTLKTLSNYMNHLARTPVDERFAAAEWAHPEERVAV